MENTKLIALLQTFNSRELRELKNYIASPFFNNNSEVMLFYDYLKKYAPHFPPKKIERLRVYEKLFPSRTFDRKHFNYLTSDLFRLASDYIGYQKYKQQGQLSQCHVLSSFVDRSLNREYQYLYQKIVNEQEKSIRRDTAFYYQQHLLADIANRYFDRQKVRKSDTKLQQAASYFDHYYLAQKLKYSVEILDRQLQLATEYQIDLLEEVQNYLKIKPYDNVPPIAIYYKILQLLTHSENYNHFFDFKNLFQQYNDKFSESERRHIYMFALNYCIRKVREGVRIFWEEADILFKQGIEQKWLFEDGKLSPWTYKNAIRLAIRLEQYTWAEEFIVTYNKFLIDEFREDALYFNLAELHYAQKKYNKALEYLNQVSFSDIQYNLSTKRMLIKIYFELKEEEPLISLLNAFRLFLKRNKLLSEDITSSHLNFIAAINLLLKPNTENLHTLQEKINTTKLLMERSWLQEQVFI